MYRSRKKQKYKEMKQKINRKRNKTAKKDQIIPKMKNPT